MGIAGPALAANILTQITDAVVAIDFEGCVLFWNQGAERLYGRTSSEMLGQPLSTCYCYEYLNGEDDESILEEIRRTGRWSGDNLHHVGDGRKLIVESEVSLLREESGEMIGLSAVIRDVTEKRRRERGLLLGGKQLCPETDKNLHGDSNGGAIRDGASRSIVDQGKMQIAPNSEKVGSNGWPKQFTDPPAGQEELALKEKRFRSLARASNQIVWITDDEGKLTNALRDWQEFTGQTDQEVVDTGWADVIHPEDREYTLRAFQASIKSGKPYSLEHRVRRHDGVFRDMAAIAVPVRGDGGRIVEWVGSHTDITERNKVDAALREQAALLELANDTIFTCALDGTIEFWNLGAERMYGFPKSEAIGRISYDLLSTVLPKPLADVECDLLRDGCWEGELIQTAANGARIVVDSRWVLRSDKNGIPSGILKVNHDVTARKRAEEERFETHQRLAALMRALPVGVSFSNDITCHDITGNPAVLAQFEFSPNDNLSASALDPAAPGRQVRFVKNGRIITDAELPLQRAVVENREIPCMELDVHLPSGRSWKAECYGAPIRDVNGNVIGGVAVTVDVTERKLAEQESQKAYQRLEKVLSTISDGFLVLDKTWCYTYFNEQGARILGMRREDLIGRCVWDVFPYAKGARFYDCYHQAVETQEPVHFEEFYPEPLDKWLECHCYPSDEGLSVYFRDITDRKAAEESIRASESRFRKLFDSGLMGIGIPDRFGAFVEGNDELLRMTGYSRADLKAGKVRWDIMTPPEYAELDAFHIAEAAERGSCSPYEKEYIRKDGTRVPIMCGYALLEGSTDQYIGFVQDLSLLKQAETGLREREQRFRVLAESLPQLVWIRDADGRYIYGNQHFYDFLGISLEEIKTVAYEYIHPEDRSKTAERWKRSVETGCLYTNEYRLRSQDGVYRHFLARGVPLHDENGRIQQWVGCSTDIHDQKMAEEALRRTEKLNATARLAASMAHEINNPLTAVVNALYLAMLDKTLSESTRGFLKLADEELSRSVQVATRMLRFHRQSTAPSLVDLSEIMDSALALYGSRLSSSAIQVEREYLTQEKLHCMKDELRQAFAHLISNSVDAIKGGGLLHVRIASGIGWDGASTRGLRITVADNGQGIPQELRDKVFEPFVSTKENVGTGLGLWVAEGIIKKHSGRISFRSSTDPVRHGTVFSLFLPLKTEEALHQQEVG